MRKPEIAKKVRSLAAAGMTQIIDNWMSTYRNSSEETPPKADVTAPMKKAIAASWEAYVGTDPTKKKIRDLWVALTDETLNEGLTKQGYDSSFKSWVKWYKSTVESDPSIKFLSPEQVADRLEDMFKKGTEAIRNDPWDKVEPSSPRTVVSKIEESVYNRWQNLIKG